KVAAGQVANQIVGTPFWSSMALSQTVPGGSGPTDVTGASVLLGTLLPGDVVDVDLTFGQLLASIAGSFLSVRLSGDSLDIDITGLSSLFVSKRTDTSSFTACSGSGRVVISSRGNYNIRARVTAAAGGELAILGTATLKATVFRP